MNVLQEMLAAHPQPAANNEGLGEAARHLAACSQVCTSCADACLAEPMVADLRHCIRLNLDCADVCAATSHVVVRQTQTDPTLVQALLNACLTACRLCADECSRHANMHEHCRVCADHCRRCVEVCEAMLEALPSG